MEVKVPAVPEGCHTLNCHIIVDGAAAAIEFYKKAFGAIETYRVPAPGGKLGHAELMIGDSTLMLSDAFPEWGAIGPTGETSPVTLHVYVENVDSLFAQAVAAGATVTMPLADMFWGDRYGKLKDPFGHHWSLATHTKDLTPEEVAAAAEVAMASMSPPATPDGAAPAPEAAASVTARKPATKAAKKPAAKKSAAPAKTVKATARSKQRTAPKAKASAKPGKVGKSGKTVQRGKSAKPSKAGKKPAEKLKSMVARRG